MKLKTPWLALVAFGLICVDTPIQAQDALTHPLIDSALQSTSQLKSQLFDMADRVKSSLLGAAPSPWSDLAGDDFEEISLQICMYHSQYLQWAYVYSLSNQVAIKQHARNQMNSLLGLEQSCKRKLAVLINFSPAQLVMSTNADRMNDIADSLYESLTRVDAILANK